MNVFGKLKLNHSFAIVYGIFTLGFLVYGAWSFVTLNKLKINGPTYQRIMQGKNLVGDIKPPSEYIIESYLVSLQMAGATDQAKQDQFLERFKVLQKEYDTYHEYWSGAGLEPKLADLLLKQSHDPAIIFYRIASDELIPALHKQDKQAANNALERMTQAYDQHRSVIDQIVQLANRGNEDEEAHAAQQVRIGMWLMLAILVTALALGLALALIIFRRVLKQLGGDPAHVSEVARHIAEGDLTMEIAVPPRDNQSMIARMKIMQRMLRKTVAEIQKAVDMVSSASSEIAAGNMDLSERTEQQASSLEETASSMEEMTATVKQNADNARQANQLALSASDVAIKGGNVVSQVVETMGSINASSKKIVDIISVIDSIAFQTNILALNAAVEAARAGEQGRGFAVVANEVRNLAQRSAAAAKEIKELIGNSVEKINTGNKLVDQAGTTMQEIIDSVKRVTDIMADIMAASLEQSEGIEQINKAITQMDEVTQQNAALVEEASAAAASLQEQAVNLTQTVNVFKTDANRQSITTDSEQTVRTQASVMTRMPRASSAQPTIAPPRRKIADTATATKGEWEEF
ncbi:MAG: methyl-accepting chemotaxis protein [Gallionellaceae bacterium]|nr:methyl-accepting chemotaxis protein [Gallionellaceae bacterium]